MNVELHRAFDQGAVALSPTLDPVLARLTCELIYQLQRQRSYSGENGGPPPSQRVKQPIRPNFDLFYQYLEGPLAVVEVSARSDYAWDMIARVATSPHRLPTSYSFTDDEVKEAKLQTDGFSPFPLLTMSISTNILLYATRQQISKWPPFSEEKCSNSRVRSLFHETFLRLQAY